ncbi:RNA polymerase sigma factor [Pontimicrobium sp. SW4]|uniref:RNA polymerase sigma factor n=1 Tax=Pontimicrobium sp. SW4 TaxID=3153519 RepID=A0AAU7BU75_9FLAO
MKSNIEILIAGSIKNDERCKMELYDSYCDAMYNIACRYVKNNEDAKDVMQEGFLKAFLNIKSYKTEFSFGAWLKRIIINQSIDYLKKRKLELVNTEVEELQIIDTEDWNFSARITKDQIIKSVEQLSEKYKIVVKMYLFEGYDHEEISQILEIPIKTSRTHLRRGRIKLQELLKDKRYGTGY